MNFRSRFFVVLLFTVVALGGLYYGWHQSDLAARSKLQALLIASAKPLRLDSRVQSTNCKINGAFPDHACTPGAIFPDATTDSICVLGYTKIVRSTPVSLKKEIYAQYGLSYPQAYGAYEADHLIPLELGGSNDIANLFPEAAEPTPGFHEKDIVENYLHQEVCAGRMALNGVQEQIASDWLAVYNSLSSDQIQALKQQFKSWSY